MNENTIIDENIFSQLSYLISKSTKTDNKSLSQLLYMMTILIVAMKKSGASFEEITKELQEYKCNNKDEEAKKLLLIRVVESIYYSCGCVESDGKEVIKTLMWLPVFDLLNNVWKSVMLEIERELEKYNPQIEDGSKYQSLELLDDVSTRGFAHVLK